MIAPTEQLAVDDADREAERPPSSTRSEDACPWARFLRERPTENARIAPRRWRDEEGL